MDLTSSLTDRFGTHRVSSIPVEEGNIPLLALDLESRTRVTVIVTNGLSNYSMPVPEKYTGREFNELYFCLPDYWDWQDLGNPRMNWIFPWIQRLAKHAMEKNTWYGPGHTMPCGKDMESLSETMQQNHFLLSDPLLLERELAPLTVNGKTIHFLSIIPLFPDEMDYKQGKGTYKLLQKLHQHGVSELLDDYRSTVLRSKWRLRLR